MRSVALTLLFSFGFAAAVVGQSVPKLPKGVRVTEEPSPAPWSPPKTTIPKEFVDETVAMLAHGLGDPRGRTYGSALVDSTGHRGAQSRPVEVHGWISRKAPRRIVSTNGLVYDVRALGADASLESDVRRMETPNGAGEDSPYGAGWKTFVRLLLIAGRTDFAERFYEKLPYKNYDDFNDWVVLSFHQAVEAHMAGDDRTALRVSREILRERPVWEESALARHGRRNATGTDGQPYKTDEQFPFLNDVPLLAADAVRRLTEPPRPPFDPRTASVETLIDRLDEVDEQQHYQPGSVDLDHDPIVAALIAKGGEAGEPLLRTLEQDDRLTRSVSYHRDFHPARNLISVKSAALVAFRTIAGVDQLPGVQNGSVDVKGLRRYWKENGALSREERLMKILADDSAGDARWSEARDRLFSRTAAGKGYPTETLRARSNPSLGDLLAKRATELCVAGPSGGPKTFERASGLRFAECLAEWEAAASLPVLRGVSHVEMEHVLLNKDPDLDQGTAEALVAVLERRAKLNDLDVWPEYAAWIPHVGPLWNIGGNSSVKILLSMIGHRDLPIMREAARKTFLDPGAPNDLARIAKDNPGSGWAESLAFSPLLALPEVRQDVGRVLDDQTTIGDCIVDDQGGISFRHDGSMVSGSGADERVLADPLLPSPGETRPFRICDRMAERLAELKGAPPFHAYWPTAEKDAAIIQIRLYIDRNAGRIVDLIDWPFNWRDSPFGP